MNVGRQAVIKADGVGKRFGQFWAVDGVSFELHQGEILGVVGPNGAGKSTLLDLVSGRLTLDRGSVNVLGRGIAGMGLEKVARRGAVRTFQRPLIVDCLTVLDNLMLASMIQGGESWWRSLAGRLWNQQETEIKIQALAMLDRFELTEKAGEYASALSFGEVKMVTLAMALLSGARVIGLDEPVAGMAGPMRSNVASMLARERTAGRSFLVIEHDLEFLASVADRLLLLYEGALLLEDEPGNVLSSPEALRAYLGE